MKKGTFEYLRNIDAGLTNLNQKEKISTLLFELLKQFARIADSLEYFEQREKGF